MTGRASHLATARRPDRGSEPMPACGRNQRATTGAEDAVLIGRIRMERQHGPTPEITMGGRPFHGRNRPSSRGQQECHCWKVSPVGPDRATVADQGSGGRPRPAYPGPRCPTLVELQGRADCEPSAPPTVRAHDPPPRPIPAPVARDLPMPQPPVAALRGNHPCCWPIGEPGKSGFRFCNELNVEGKPYCPEHCDTAYPRWRRRRSAP